MDVRVIARALLPVRQCDADGRDPLPMCGGRKTERGADAHAGCKGGTYMLGTTAVHRAFARGDARTATEATERNWRASGRQAETTRNASIGRWNSQRRCRQPGRL